MCANVSTFHYYQHTGTFLSLQVTCFFFFCCENEKCLWTTFLANYGNFFAWAHFLFQAHYFSHFGLFSRALFLIVYVFFLRADFMGVFFQFWIVNYLARKQNTRSRGSMFVSPQNKHLKGSLFEDLLALWDTLKERIFFRTVIKWQTLSK